jgi:outer membrane protein assembly factor BamB
MKRVLWAVSRPRLTPVRFLVMLGLITGSGGWPFRATAADGRPAAPTPNWPQFRGPQSLGISASLKLPDQWSTNRNLAWKTDLPGTGWSSPIVWGESLFITTVVNEGEGELPQKGLYLGGERPNSSPAKHRWTVCALDFRTGRIRWQKTVHEGAPSSPIHLKNSYASETPVTDGERVYAYFGNVGLYCLDFDGKVVWTKQWGPFKMRNGWGTGSSPVLYQDRVYVLDDNEEQSFLLALDKKSGEQVWRVERDEKSNWATPYLWENEKRTELVVPASSRLRSYDLNGKPLWELGRLSTISIPTPVAIPGLLFVSSGFVADKNRPAFAVRPGASGDISPKEGETNSPYLAWFNKTAGAYNPSPLVYGDYFYVLYDFGTLSCFEASTGKEVYARQRLDIGRVSGFTASPWAYREKIFCLSEDGDTYVIQAGAAFKLLGKNSLGEMCLATPALTEDSLLLRSASKLYRIRNQEKP